MVRFPACWNFGKADEKNNSVTAYVSRVKTGGTSLEGDQDEKKGNPVKTVTYHGEDIKFYAQGTTLNDLDKGKKHTLTMYYMERGMWESNMACVQLPDITSCRFKRSRSDQRY